MRRRVWRETPPRVLHVVKEITFSLSSLLTQPVTNTITSCSALAATLSPAESSETSISTCTKLSPSAQGTLYARISRGEGAFLFGFLGTLKFCFQLAEEFSRLLQAAEISSLPLQCSCSSLMLGAPPRDRHDLKPRKAAMQIYRKHFPHLGPCSERDFITTACPVI